MTDEHLIEELGTELQARYDREGRPLSFGAYLERFLAEPTPQCRGAAHYIRDTFDHFGVETRDTPAGPARRFKVFDAAFRSGDGRVAGQEAAQQAIYRLLNNFVREGRVNRLILLHGPNGSAKTTLIRAIVQGMEHYSTTDAGALYRFRWIFPTEKLMRGTAIGFGESAGGDEGPPDSYAHLSGDAIDSVLECDLNDHPLLLLPLAQRQRLLRRLQDQGRLPAEFPLPESLWHGGLCDQCRRIHDALLAAYNGDVASVLRHVQVLRLTLSGRYRRGVSVVEPQMHVDAAEAQMTASRGLSALPRAIAHLDLFQVRGPLVDANRGLLEYNDLLKRHIDTFKYLLVTCENGQVALNRSTLHLDTVFIGSTNEMLLDSFKEYPDFASFKGRLELVLVPYLRRVSQEVRIYRDQLSSKTFGRHLAPHTLELAALWAVLTRLRKPSAPDDASAELAQAISSLDPLEKAMLLDSGQVPNRLPARVARELMSALPELSRLDGKDYEGRVGASAREVHMLLMNAAQREDQACVSPVGLFTGIRELLADKSVFGFLQVRPNGQYQDHDALLELVDRHYLDTLEQEAASAMGLVTETSYQELFDRYVQNVSHWLRKEKLSDPVTGKPVEPNESLMAEVESIIRSGDEDPEAFRKTLIARVGAYSLDAEKQGSAGGEKPDYARVFPAMFERLKDDFMAKRRATIRRLLERFLALMEGETLEGRDAKRAEAMRQSLIERFGYCERCAEEAMGTLLERRFRD